MPNPSRNLLSADEMKFRAHFFRYLIPQAMKTYQHIIFWVLVYGTLTLVIGKWFGNHVEAFYYVSMLLPVVIGTSYFFNYYLVPRYLFTRRFLLFGLYSWYMLVVSLCMEMLVSVLAMLLMIRFNVSDTGVLVTDVFTLAGLMYFVVLLLSFILLIRHYYSDQRSISNLEEQQEKLKKGYLTVRSERKDARIGHEEITYIESLSDYVHIHRRSGEKIISKMKISHIEQELPDTFLRIHRSFIVNTDEISSFSREEVLLGNTPLPVSRTYRTAVVNRLRSDSGTANSPGPR